MIVVLKTRMIHFHFETTLPFRGIIVVVSRRCIRNEYAFQSDAYRPLVDRMPGEVCLQEGGGVAPMEGFCMQEGLHQQGSA